MSLLIWKLWILAKFVDGEKCVALTLFLVNCSCCHFSEVWGGKCVALLLFLVTILCYDFSEVWGEKYGALPLSLVTSSCYDYYCFFLTLLESDKIRDSVWNCLVEQVEVKLERWRRPSMLVNSLKRWPDWVHSELGTQDVRDWLQLTINAQLQFELWACHLLYYFVRYCVFAGPKWISAFVVCYLFMNCGERNLNGCWQC